MAEIPHPGDAAEVSTTPVVIIGAGMSGLCMGIELSKHGIPFVILEKSQDVGGTWLHNTYPGCACDVPSALYSYSFAPNPAWSHKWSGQPEILDYLRRCAQRFGVRGNIRFGTNAVEARFDEDDGTWRITCTDGSQLRAQHLVNAAGGLHRPSYPDIPGRERFEGITAHTGAWDSSLDLRGKRVAVVGSAASAVQLVPAVAAHARSVTVFQRTPNFVVSRDNYAYSEAQKRRFRRWPWIQRAHRWWFYWRNEAIFSLLFQPGRVTPPAVERYLRWKMRRAVDDPVLRAKVTPPYRAGCKRILVDSDYYAALQRDNVDLVCAPIEEITPEGLRCGHDTYAADVLVFATGFEIWDQRWVGKIYGRDGLSLADATGDAPRTYLGMSIPHFPNLFALLGPNTGLGHSSVVWMMECQVRYIRRLIMAMRREQLPALEPREDVVDREYLALQRRLAKMVWVTGGCKSWYQAESGEIVALWPGHTYEYWWKTRRPRLEHYLATRER